MGRKGWMSERREKSKGTEEEICEVRKRELGKEDGVIRNIMDGVGVR